MTNIFGTHAIHFNGVAFQDVCGDHPQKKVLMFLMGMFVSAKYKTECLDPRRILNLDPTTRIRTVMAADRIFEKIVGVTGLLHARNEEMFCISLALSKSAVFIPRAVIEDFLLFIAPTIVRYEHTHLFCGHLENNYQIMCNNCDRLWTPERAGFFKKCAASGCKKQMCIDCAYAMYDCTECGGFLCNSCVIECDNCADVGCMEHDVNRDCCPHYYCVSNACQARRTCKHCNRQFCICEAFRCHGCEDTVCGQHFHECPKCEYSFCDNCSIACTECGNMLCNDCSRACGKCMTYTCFECSRHCTACEVLLCYGCADECENCEMFTCGVVDDLHARECCSHLLHSKKRRTE